MNLSIRICDPDQHSSFHGAGGRALRLAALVISALSAACSSAPTPRVADRLDPVTGTTAIVLAKPVQLETVENRGPSRDPFAFIAPFDIDRMGNRELYLWVSVPQDGGVPANVQVLCDDRPLELARVRLDLGALQLSRAPYEPIAPWSGDWYFRLPDAALACLAGAQRVTVAAHYQGEKAPPDDRFLAKAPDARGFAEFSAHLAGK